MAFSHAELDQASSTGLQGYSVPPYFNLSYEKTIFCSFIYYGVEDWGPGVSTVMEIAIGALRFTLLLE